MNSYRGWLITSIALIVGLPLLIISMATPLVAVGGATAILLLSFMMASSATIRHTLIIAIAIVSILLASSWMIGGLWNSAVVVRGTGIVMIAVVAIISHRNMTDTGSPRGWKAGLIIPLGVFLTVATLPHGLIDDFISMGIGLVMLSILLISLPAIDSDVTRNGLFLALGMILSVSLILGIVYPQKAVEADRLRGVFENANSLGFVAFFCVALCFYIRGSVAARLSMGIIALSCLVWTGSRASLLAIVVLTVGWLYVRSKTLSALVLVGGLVVTGPLIETLAASNEVFGRLFRDGNSRLGSFETALADWQLNPLLGVGLNQESAIIASTPLRALSQGGTVGLVSILVLYALLIIISIRAGWLTTWFTIAALGHSLFEGWLLSPVAPLLLVFSILWWLLLDRTDQQEQPPLRKTPTSIAPRRRLTRKAQ